MGVAGDGGIAAHHALGGVQHQQHHVRHADVPARHDDAQLLRHLVRLALAADARRVDEDVLGPSWMTVSSTESRVVPATGETIARSCPDSALSSVDLPTFGRPMIATLIRAGRRVRLAALFRSSLDGKFARHVVEQCLHADAVLGRNGEDVVEAQRVELVRQDFALRHVDLVDRQR